MSGDPTTTTVAVAATLTRLFELDTRALGLVTVQVDNLDASQTFEGYLRRRVAAAMASSTSTMPDFSLIQPVGSVDSAGNPTDSITADVDVAGSAVLELWGRMSGAGGNVRWSARKAGPKR